MTATLPAPAKLAKPRRAATPVREIRPGEVAETLGVVSSACGVIAIICAWVLLQMLVLGGIAEQRSQDLLYRQYRSELAQATAPTSAVADYRGKALAPGSPVALLTIPRLGLQQVVVSGTSSSYLLAGPGHLRTTPLPGQAGVSVVMGRGSTYGSPFGGIDTLRKGDQIAVQNGQAQVFYTVEDLRRAGDPIPAAPTGSAAGRLTLVTAQGSGFLSALRPRSAIYVDAVTTKAAPAGQVASGVPTSEYVMERDTSVLPMIVAPFPRRPRLAARDACRGGPRLGDDRPGRRPPPELDVNSASSNEENKKSGATDVRS
jgi:sortase A